MEALSPSEQRIQDAQFRALLEAQEETPKPAVDLAQDTLRSRRVALGLRSTKVADMLGIAESSLRNYESAVSEPGLKADLWQKLMALYRVDTHELFALIANTKASKEKDAALATAK